MIGLRFACKSIPLNKILSCSFGLNKTEILILMQLAKENKELAVDDIVRKVSKDKTTIQRSMKKLSSQKLVHRRQINLDRGGYVFVYSAISKSRIKEMIYSNVEQFRDAIGREIERW